MKNFVLIFLMVVAFIMAANAQEENRQVTARSKKELRQEKKADRKKDKENTRLEKEMKISSMIASKTWVLEASQLLGNGGRMFNLDQTINFVRVDQNTCTIQLGFDGLVGWNGVGGVTLEGTIVSYNITEPKKKNKGTKVIMKLQGLGINSRLQLRVTGEFGDVLLTGSFIDSRLSFRGRLVHPAESKTYKALKNN